MVTVVGASHSRSFEESNSVFASTSNSPITTLASAPYEFKNLITGLE